MRRHTAWLYARAGRTIDPDLGRRLAETADLVCQIWRQPDSGIWEVRSGPRHFTQSKMMCWVALDRAEKLAQAGHVPPDNLPRWRAEAEAIRAFVEAHCWSEARGSYVRFAGGEELDASLLLGVLFGYVDARGQRAQGTIDALRRELGRGAFLFRYSGEDGRPLPKGEGVRPSRQCLVAYPSSPPPGLSGAVCTPRAPAAPPAEHAVPRLRPEQDLSEGSWRLAFLRHPSMPGALCDSG